MGILTLFSCLEVSSDSSTSGDKQTNTDTASSTSESSGTSDVDTMSPLVVKTDPADGEVDIFITKKIVITFSEGIDEETITTDSILLYEGDREKGILVSGIVSYDAEAYKATFIPEENLLESTEYTGVIMPGIKDLSGNQIAEEYVFAFQTEVQDYAVDTTPPIVKETSPADQAQAVSLLSKMSITFSEPMDVKSLTPENFIVTAHASDILGSISYSSPSNVITFTPSAGLPANTKIQVQLTKGLKDGAGNGLVQDYFFSFTTTDSANQESTQSNGGSQTPSLPPDTLSVVSTTPENSTTGVLVASNISIVFSNDLDQTTITSTNIYMTGGGGGVAAALSYDSNSKTVTIDPTSNLARGTQYTVTINTNVKDSAGDVLNSNYSLSFTTLAPLSVASTSPSNNATNIDVGANITVTFSQGLAGASVASWNFPMTSSGGSVGTTVSYTAATNTITIDPNSNLSKSTVYTITVSSGVTDTYGGTLGQDYTFSFTTQDPTWQVVSSAGFSMSTATYTEMEIGSDGTIYVAFSDGAASANNKVTVMKNTQVAGSGWVNVGSAGFSSGAASYIDLELSGAANTPYITFKDAGNNDKAAVYKFNVNVWETYGPQTFTTTGVAYTNMELNGENPYIVYQDPANSSKASVKKYSSGNYTKVGNNLGLSSGTAAYIDLALDSSGNTYVVYQDAAQSNKASAKKAGTTGTSPWNDIGSPGFSAGAVSYCSLEMYNDVPYVVYVDGGNSSKATVMKNTQVAPAVWENVGSAGFSAGITSYTDLEINTSNGDLYVVYRDASNTNKATVMKYSGSSWATLGTAGFSAGAVSYTDLAIYNGVPYVVFVDGANVNKVTVMKYE